MRKRTSTSLLLSWFVPQNGTSPPMTQRIFGVIPVAGRPTSRRFSSFAGRISLRLQKTMYRAMDGTNSWLSAKCSEANRPHLKLLASYPETRHIGAVTVDLSCFHATNRDFTRGVARLLAHRLRSLLLCRKSSRHRREQSMRQQATIGITFPRRQPSPGQRRQAA